MIPETSAVNVPRLDIVYRRSIHPPALPESASAGLSGVGHPAKFTKLMNRPAILDYTKDYTKMTDSAGAIRESAQAAEMTRRLSVGRKLGGGNHDPNARDPEKV